MNLSDLALFKGLDSTYDGNTPKYLFDGGGKGFARIMGLRSRQTNKFCPRERECCCDEEITKPFEAVFECSRIYPE
jgi:hypothetical protein